MLVCGGRKTDDGGNRRLAMAREIFWPERGRRESVARFVDAELVPHHAQWRKNGVVPREVWRKAGEVGLLCPSIPEEYGGFGGDWLYNVVVIEELARKGITGPGFVDPFGPRRALYPRLAMEEVKRRYLPKMVSGEVIGALGMTEPGSGSDVKTIRTRAVRDGDDYVMDKEASVPTASSPTSSSRRARPIPTPARAGSA
ncbi:acyl-CoA dehydrogenase family protein [Sphingomonas sp. MMS24-JH45]